MAYESKVFIVERCEDITTYYDKIAELDLCTIERANGWRELFNKDIEGALYYDGKRIKTDRYGDKLKYATFEEVLAWCEGVTDSDLLDYRRFKLLRNLLSSIDTTLWDSLIIIHYGY